MPLWHRLVVVGVVMLITVAIARLTDRRIARRQLAPEAITRYRVARRSITTAIIFVGLLSALLVIPQVRAVAGGLLASSAVLGIVVGFASQRTLGNFVAGLRPKGPKAGKQRPESFLFRRRRLAARVDPGGKEPPAGRPEGHEQMGL